MSPKLQPCCTTYYLCRPAPGISFQISSCSTDTASEKPSCGQEGLQRKETGRGEAGHSTDPPQMLPIPTTLSYRHPQDKLAIVFHVTNKEMGSRAPYESLGMHRGSFSPVCRAEGRLWRRLLHKESYRSYQRESNELSQLRCCPKHPSTGKKPSVALGLLLLP